MPKGFAVKASLMPFYHKVQKTAIEFAKKVAELSVFAEIQNFEGWKKELSHGL